MMVEVDARVNSLEYHGKSTFIRLFPSVVVVVTEGERQKSRCNPAHMVTG